MSFLKIEPDASGDRKILLCFFIAAAALYVPLLLWNEWPTRDTALRYAPMADAFARGDYRYAFHPRCQMLLPLAAGILCKIFSISGFTGCKFAALCFYMLGAIPLFYLAKTVFDRKTALGTLLLYLFCFQLIDPLVIEGGRDSAKLFVQLWMAYELVKISLGDGSPERYARFGAACGLSVCVRGDMLFTAAAMLFWGGAMDGSRNRLPWRSLAALACAALTASLEVAVNYLVSACAVPSNRFVPLFRETFQADPTLQAFCLYAVLPAIPAFFAASAFTGFMLKDKLRKRILLSCAALAGILLLVHVVVATPCSGETLARFFRGVWRGASPPFFITAVLGMLCNLYLRRWSPAQSRILCSYLLYVLLVIGQIIIHDHRYYVSSRYMLPALPLLLPWSAIALITVWEAFQAHLKLPYSAAKTAMLLLALLGLYLAYRGELNTRTRERNRRDWETIRELQSRFSELEKSFDAPPIHIAAYQSALRPRVLFDDVSLYTVSAYLAGAGAIDYLTAEALPEAAERSDLVVSFAATDPETLRKKLYIRYDLEKAGAPISSTRGDLQIWKRVGGHDERR